VIAWLWARTVKCPNPACGADMPLVRTFALSTKKGKEWHVEPIVDGKAVRFEVRRGPASRDGTKQRGSAECLVCGTTMNDATLREQSRNLGVGKQLMAVVAEGDRQRIYLSSASEPLPSKVDDVDWLDQPLPDNARWFSPPGYGLRPIVTYSRRGSSSR
jgi:putative DNA methylase